MILSHCWPAAAWRAAGLTQNKQWRKPCAGESPHCLCDRYTYFRVPRSLLPIAQSPIRLIGVRSSTLSLTRRLSHGAWAPAKSGGDHWKDPHIPLGDVQTWCYCCCFCDQQRWLSCGTTHRCFPWWQHKGLRPTHLLRWQSQRDQFHCRRYGASLRWWGVAIGTINFIMSALASSGLLKVVSQLPILARGLSLPCTAYAALRPSVARGSLLSCMTYVANCPCSKGSLLYPAQLPSLARGWLSPSLARGSLWPYLTDVSSLSYLPYFPLAMYTPSSVYLLYSPLATYTPS